MRVTLSDARESPLAAAVFLLGVAAAVVAIVFGDGGFDAPAGSPLFLVGLGAAAIAIGIVIAERVRS
ncbi:hypothetical protein [Salinarchaeum laminariae]|mgnify:CR=1 FL=1|uniref:hypothetical protein n=1 Tax=Salinarchaeum laminariae TaxID=869888 RepID=UPI0020C0EA8A|nr:hypothetical protein [Salinarchaeum laminariae]